MTVALAEDESPPRSRRASERFIESAQQSTSVPGEWLELEKNHPKGALRQLKRHSEALRGLRELREREAAKDKPVAWINSAKAEIFFAIVLLLYAVWAGVDVDVELGSIAPSEASKTALVALQGLFNLVFIVELILHVRADGIGYCSPCKNLTGFFDTAIILVGVIELAVSLFGFGWVLFEFGPMRLLRLLRLFRLGRIMVVCKELRLLLTGMASSVRAVMAVSVLLGMVIYLGTLFCVIFLGKNPDLQDYFGSVGLGLFTHFQIVTLEAWPDISDSVMAAAGPLWAVYFICFICISSLALLSLVTGVVCEKMMNDKPDAEESGEALDKICQKERNDLQTSLNEVFEDVDELDADNGINRHQFAALVKRADMKAVLQTADVSSDMEGKLMFDLLDSRGRGSLNCEQLAEALLRLRGSRGRLHSVLLQADIMTVRRREAEKVRKLEDEVSKQSQQDLQTLEEDLMQELGKVEALALERLKRQLTPQEEAPRTPPKVLPARHASPPRQPPAPPWNDEVARVRGLLDELDALCINAEELLDPPPPRRALLDTPCGVIQGTQTE